MFQEAVVLKVVMVGRPLPGIGEPAGVHAAQRLALCGLYRHGEIELGEEHLHNLVCLRLPAKLPIDVLLPILGPLQIFEAKLAREPG